MSYPFGAALTDRVALLLATYNGQRFLGAQLASLAEQLHPDIDIWASDDGSTDQTSPLLNEAAAGWAKGEFHVLHGPRLGFAENFRSLLVNPAIQADYFAFCDQDDLWDCDKLSAALAWLKAQESDLPALYCSRTRQIDESGQPMGLSPLFKKAPSFRNALVQSIAGGNTMVMNAAARSLVAEASRRSGFVSHDWWCYLLVTGAGGIVHYAPEPRIAYRQHGSNLVGENRSLRSRLGRYRFLAQGGFASWTDRNIAGLRACEDLLSDEPRKLLDRFDDLRKAPPPQRLAEIHRCGLYRQTLPGHFGLYVASLINRL